MEQKLTNQLCPILACLVLCLGLVGITITLVLIYAT